MNIPKDSQGKTAGQRDREARREMQKARTRLSRFLLALLVLAAAAVALMICAEFTT